MIRKIVLLTVALCWALAACCAAPAAEADDIVAKIERMASLGEKADPSLFASIAEAIENGPADVSTKLLTKLKDKNATESQLAAYIWAIGLTKDPMAVDAIIELHRQNKSDLIKANCLRAVGTIGGKQAGGFLIATLDATTDKEMRFNIFNLLGQMQCEVALPKTEEILKQDPEKFYWQSIFVFGKMGDKAVPFLLPKLVDKDRNVRANAINVLGTWLIAPEAAKPLQDCFWTETDPELRGIILSSLEKTVADFAQIEAAFRQVVAKEQDEKLLKYAGQTLEGMEKMKSAVAALAKKKKPSAATFQRQYAQLFNSAGKKGDYEALVSSSTIQDEPKLKALRERILQRDSDEAFYDFQKVNAIIVQNRLLSAAERKAVKP